VIYGRSNGFEHASYLRFGGGGGHVSNEEYGFGGSCGGGRLGSQVGGSGRR
jgi:hypothetical protein